MTMLTYTAGRRLLICGVVLCALATPIAVGKSPGDAFERDAYGVRMLWAPPGAFRMGSTNAEIDGALELCEAARGSCAASWVASEQPHHEVSLAGFWIDATEVTNEQFCRFLNSEGNRIEGGRAWLDVRSPDCLILEIDDEFRPKEGFEDHPVVEVSWFGANAYATWAGGRLPTEAEWAYAARGPDSAVFPWGNSFDGTALSYCDANCAFDTRNESSDDGYARTAPVGIYPTGASWVGALDMAGNVWEWCADWYSSTYYQESPAENPTGPPTGTRRVCRGGAWGGDPYDVRSARRGGIRPRDSYASIGFRCVMDACDVIP